MSLSRAFCLLGAPMRGAVLFLPIIAMSGAPASATLIATDDFEAYPTNTNLNGGTSGSGGAGNL